MQNNKEHESFRIAKTAHKHHSDTAKTYKNPSSWVRAGVLMRFFLEDNQEMQNIRDGQPALFKDADYHFKRGKILS